MSQSGYRWEVIPSSHMSRSSPGATEVELFDFLIVSNRLPIEPGPAGRPAQWRASPGGLVSALQPVITKNGGAWVGWTGEPAEAQNEVAPGPREPGSWWEDTGQISVVAPSAAPILEDPAVSASEDAGALGNARPYAIPVSLSAAEIACYYEGFCNATIWPLYHDVIAPPVYSRRWWHCYVEVNRRFATTVAAHSAHGATVWVHDYHLQLCPTMLRELRPDLRIGFFNHIPFPPYELIAQLPWRKEVIEGLLGADLIGFQTADGADNFLRACRRLTDHHTQGSIVHVKADGEAGARTARAAAFPISVDTEELSALAQRPDVVQRAREIREEVGNPECLFLGVDRLDYTKGILHRLRAYGELLKEGKLHPPEAVLVQIASPSRGEVEEYQRLRDELERAVGSMNGDFSAVGHPAVHYLHQSFPKEEMAAFYLAADVALVTPLRDGMNLVAKEYVACRYDLGGRLVLSEFTGAANELTGAFLVNPHDIDSLKARIIAAMGAPQQEAMRRMRRLRRRVFDHDVHRWAAEFLGALDGGRRPVVQADPEGPSQIG
jgi:trehalose 6-phosphate synthase